VQLKRALTPGPHPEEAVVAHIIKEEDHQE
jgi:hypothetical protein